MEGNIPRTASMATVYPYLPDMSAGATSPGSIRRVFRIVSPTCEDMTELISAMMDRQLPLTTRLRMRLHFLYCRYCRRVRDHFVFLREATAALDENGVAGGEELGAADKEKLRRALRGEYS